MIEKVLVAGGGVLGSQIALQNAVYGKKTVLYDISEEALIATKQRLNKFVPAYVADTDFTTDKVIAAIDKIEFTTNLVTAIVGVDLIIEAIPENLAIKEAFYTELSAIVADDTIIATNSSTLLPSRLAIFVKDSRRFVALHFANIIWTHNTAEIMGHVGTEHKIIVKLKEYALTIGMIPIPVKKEHAAYVLNSLLMPLLDAAMKLWYDGIAEPATIDKTWMIATGAPNGPFGTLDVVGLRTIYNISVGSQDAKKQAIAAKLKQDYIDHNKLGVETGVGFYTYPNPEYQQEDFLKY